MSFVKSIFSITTVFVVVCIALTNSSNAQVIINEVLVDPLGNDGTPPNSSEWIELYNPTGADINISCMLISDGDVVLTIPSPTFIPAGETFTIGSSVGLTSPDLNWASCGCSSNTPLTMSFDNTAEQIFLYDNSGQLVNGVTWGSGSFGPGSSGTGIVSSIAVGACTSTFNLDFSVNPNDPNVSSINVIEGQSNALDCTNTNFVNDSNPNPGETNNAQVAVANIDSPPLAVCAGSSVTFSAAGSLGADTYNWTAGAGGAVNGINYENTVFNTPGNATVTLTVTNSCGITSDTVSVSIQVDEAPIVTVTATLDGAPYAAPFDICDDQTLVLSTTAIGAIQWTLAGNPIPGETSSSYTIAGVNGINGTYGFTAINGVCTSTSAGDAVTISPTPTASVISTLFEACVNDAPLTIEAQPGFTATPPLNAYSWTIGGVAAGTNSTLTISTATAAAYAIELVVTDGICASDPLALSAEVFAYPVVEITPAGPLDLCPDDQVILSSVNTHETYQWNLNGAQLSGETGQSLNFTYDQPSTSTLTLTASDNGCETTTTVPVSIIEHDVATIASWTPPPYAENNTLFTCQDNHPILAVSDGAQFQWYYNGTAIPGEIGLTLTADQDGEYYYTSSIDGFCEIYSDTITVDLEMSLEIETFASKDTACVGDTVLIIPDGDFVSYSWNGGFVGDTLEVTNTGIYIVTAHLVSCDTTDTVSVYFSPYPVVNAGDDFYSDCEDNTLLYGATTGDSTYWELDDLLLTYGDTVVIPTPTRTSDLVMISYLNECEARDTVNIKVDCVYIFAPTAITPDGDGLNDVFKIYTNGLTQYTLRIFNRYGQVVFETSDPDEVWTGGYNDYYLPNGVYTWQIEALDFNQEEALSKARSKGVITVVR